MEQIFSGQNRPLTSEEKAFRLNEAEVAYGQFLDALGYDWRQDPNMKGTPHRVAKMYMNEITQGTYDQYPKVTVFPNGSRYNGMVFEGGVDIKSICSHHMMPFVGKAYVAYIPGEQVIGLSKLNRIVEFFSRRPQLQEQLTQQIHDELNSLLVGNRGVAVMIEASHTCVSLRGVNQNSIMKTAQLSGAFEEPNNNARVEFYSLIK